MCPPVAVVIVSGDSTWATAAQGAGPNADVRLFLAGFGFQLAFVGI